MRVWTGDAEGEDGSVRNVGCRCGGAWSTNTGAGTERRLGQKVRGVTWMGR